MTLLFYLLYIVIFRLVYGELDPCIVTGGEVGPRSLNGVKDLTWVPGPKGFWLPCPKENLQPDKSCKGLGKKAEITSRRRKRQIIYLPFWNENVNHNPSWPGNDVYKPSWQGNDVYNPSWPGNVQPPLTWTSNTGVLWCPGGHDWVPIGPWWTGATPFNGCIWFPGGCQPQYCVQSCDDCPWLPDASLPNGLRPCI